MLDAYISARAPSSGSVKSPSSSARGPKKRPCNAPAYCAHIKMHEARISARVESLLRLQSPSTSARGPNKRLCWGTHLLRPMILQAACISARIAPLVNARADKHPARISARVEQLICFPHATRTEPA